MANAALTALVPFVSARSDGTHLSWNLSADRGFIMLLALCAAAATGNAVLATFALKLRLWSWVPGVGLATASFLVTIGAPLAAEKRLPWPLVLAQLALALTVAGGALVTLTQARHIRQLGFDPATGEPLPEGPPQARDVR